VLMFSGAFIAGSLEQVFQIARALASLYSATVVAINYRLAPEYAFPTAIHDAIESVIWAAQNAGSPLLTSNPNLGFVFGGASSGGNLAAVLTRYFQHPSHALPHAITGQWLGVAQLFPLDACSVPFEYSAYFHSRTQNADAPILNAAALEAGSVALHDDPDSELRFPVNSSTSLGGQPRTYVQLCGMDPLRDDGLVYEEMFKRAGVETRVGFYVGCPHGFWLVVPEEEGSVRAVEDIVTGIGWLLRRSVGREEVASAL
jgi:acetyl esterase/lipase